MELRVARRREPAARCRHGVRLAQLDLFLAESDGIARSMYCPVCRSEEQDEIDAELGDLLTDPDAPFSIEQVERELGPDGS